ncbi:hypothetical protein G7Y89_g11579 [Cudoniella acicularis]|uniref:Tyrosinase copper-binding domain-containing protein n=1 Tax=Cudoniella acicularis TaxID=354080 RepID=A0A8H4RCV6_9HELO|nr:hypothetical protein G7Y89_g11579 [Cudoniella acicularis]
MVGTRRSLRELIALHKNGGQELNNFIRALRGIQRLPPTDENSFFHIAGTHGEPFRKRDGDWRFGGADITIVPGVMLPYWDECFDSTSPLPDVLTNPVFLLDGDDNNPLYSYKLQQALKDTESGKEDQYSKPQGYTTVRYPLSGLVGTQEDRGNTEAHNQKYGPVAENELNKNLKEWMLGTVKIDTSGGEEKTGTPDTYSIYSRFKLCMDAPNYTVFSNTTSQNAWIEQETKRPVDENRNYVVSLESPHNAIHLAIGGFFQSGIYNANPIRGANGDMGDNETASFDPIFFLHHCFIDYVFWKWQVKQNFTERGSLKFIKDFKGTFSEEAAQPFIPPYTNLHEETPLRPFTKSDGNFYTTLDVTNITELGYEYGVGSFDLIAPTPDIPATEIQTKSLAPFTAYKKVSGIDRGKIRGSFIIYLNARDANGNEVVIGREPILSRWQTAGCLNCQTHLNAEAIFAIDENTLNSLKGTRKKGGLQTEEHSPQELEFWGTVGTRDKEHKKYFDAPQGHGILEGDQPREEIKPIVIDL